MPSFLYTPLIVLAVVCVIMMIAWLIATAIHNYSIVDICWSFNFAVIAILILNLADGDGNRKLWVCSLVTLWSIRLGLHLTARIFSHIKEEEGRYKQLRQDWQQYLRLKFFLFYQAQALSNVFLAIPFFIMAANPNPYISPVEYTGAVLWLVSIMGEGLADYQLKKFKANPANAGKVCNVGLWHYSRHPNYFFQLCIWLSVFIMALPSPNGWLAILCPLCISYLLFKVTGIPMTEEQSLRSKGTAYAAYQRTTSVFIPWFPKN